LNTEEEGQLVFLAHLCYLLSILGCLQGGKRQISNEGEGPGQENIRKVCLLVCGRKEILNFMVLEVTFRSSVYLKLVLATNSLVAYLQEVANLL